MRSFHLATIATILSFATSMAASSCDLNGEWICTRYCPAGGEGKTATVRQEITFTNEGGMVAHGSVAEGAALTAGEWNNLSVTVGKDCRELRWANGTVWVRPGARHDDGGWSGGGGLGFRFLDMNTDYVGEWDNGHPDGRPDGHFSLDLDLGSGDEIRSVVVMSADQNGNPVGGQVWHTSNGSYWMLGVFSEGRQLNYSHQPSMGQFRGRTHLDLYGDDSGWFKTGNYFVVEVQLGSGTKLHAQTRIGGGDQVESAGRREARFRFSDMRSDYVGQWDNGHPDGHPDGHFIFDADLGDGGEVQSIAVRSADANGNPMGGQVWHSADGNFWILGVFVDGRQLNTSHVSSLGRFRGRVRFDLYGSDSGWFKRGNTFIVDLQMVNGARIHGITRLD